MRHIRRDFRDSLIGTHIAGNVPCSLGSFTALFSEFLGTVNKAGLEWVGGLEDWRTGGLEDAVYNVRRQDLTLSKLDFCLCVGV